MRVDPCDLFDGRPILAKALLQCYPDLADVGGNLSVTCCPAQSAAMQGQMPAITGYCAMKGGGIIHHRLALSAAGVT